MKTVHVAAGVICNQKTDEVLAVQRGYGDMAGLWEFPGGKVERGEQPIDACVRELSEELHVTVSNLRNFYTVEFDYDDFHLSMDCFLCQIDSGEIERTEQMDIRWVKRETLATLQWAPADVEVARVLTEAGNAEGDERQVKRRRDSRKSMQGNKRANTKPELLVRQRLREAGLTGYRLQWKKAPGRPDIAFPGRKIAIFVNGCFWHRCPHCNPSMPKRNTDFWIAKFKRNMERDQAAIAELEKLGWTAITIWECELKKNEIDQTMERVIAQIREASKGSPAAKYRQCSDF